MTTNFTFRDFFVYMLTGLTFYICVCIIYYDELFKLAICFFCKYNFFNNSTFILSLLLIPATYLVGHIIGTLNYNLLNLYVSINKSEFFKREMPKWKYFILIKLQQLLYRQRIVYQIINYSKSDKIKQKLFENINEFWILCAKLQIEKIYSPAEYWYVLNEFFNSINLICFISSILSFITDQYLLGSIFLLFTILAFRRAKQYASHFVQTVCNLTIAKQTTSINLTT